VKIQRLLTLPPSADTRRFLEIGTGSGVMAGHFGSDLMLDVVSVDVVDERVVEDGYEFRLVDDVILPFDDASFDVVVSNHVIEHVGASDNQLTHLREINRVMSHSGVGYLAVPNRWALIEPHFGLPFLSWLPESWRSGYVRASRKGNDYDVRPLGYRELNRMLGEAGLGFEHLEVEAVRLMGESERAGFLSTTARHIPNSLLAPLEPVSPTLVCKLFHTAGVTR
jgi:SAM-dependent methyltransferase